MMENVSTFSYQEKSIESNGPQFEDLCPYTCSRDNDDAVIAFAASHGLNITGCQEASERGDCIHEDVQVFSISLFKGF